MLGSLYLGVDVQAMAVGILEKADIEVPAILINGARPNEQAPGPETATDELPQTIEETTTADSPNEVEPADVDGEVAVVEPTTTIDAVESELTEAERKAATQACWIALSECIQEESANRSKSIRDPGNWQLFDYLLHRKDGHQKVVDAIEQIDQRGVDPRLAVHVEQVLKWHREGAKLFERAALLLTDAPAGRLSGPFAQSWQSAATQHRMEEKLILNKHTSVASYLEHSYKAVESTMASE